MIILDGYPMDLAISEEHSFPGEVTAFPVESGSDITDHIRALPEEITLECIASDSPIGEIANDPTRQATGPDAPLPSADAYQKLREIRTARRAISITTSLGVFESMALIDLSVPKNKDTDGGLFFTVMFRRIEIVTNRRTRVRVSTPMAGAGGKARSRVTVGTAMRVDAELVWRKGVPPGAPLKAGFKTERVTAQAKRPDPEANALLAEGSPFIEVTRFRGEGGREIEGAERKALEADLVRDRQEKDAAGVKAFLALTPEEQARTIRHLPPGLDLSRFERPPPGPTFPTPPATPTFPTGTIR